MQEPDYGNVPSQPQYGQVQEIEAQEQGAPLPTETAPAPMAPGPPAAAAPNEQVYQVNPNNIVDVLPPPSTAPEFAMRQPPTPEKELAYMILGTPGMGNLARSLAAQIVGKYPVESHIPQQQLSREAQAELHLSEIAQEAAGTTVT